MYETVGRFFSPTGPGAPFVTIDLIAHWRDELGQTAAKLRAEEKRQAALTTTTTRKRTDVKKDAATHAESLRSILLVVSSDDELLALLETQSALAAAKGDDAAYLSYLGAIVAGIAAITPALLQSAGYDPQVLATLTTELTALTASTGATRDIQIETAAATDALPGLFEHATFILDKKLDRLVNAQRPNATLGALVPEYHQARRVVHTPAKRRPAARRGPTPYDQPTLALDRTTRPGTSLVLGNRSGKGVTLLYYVADQPTARPTPDQGLVVKRNQQVHLGPDTLLQLGPAGARYLLVIQQQMAADGQYWVRA